MLRSSFFWRLFGSYAFLVLLTLAAVGTLVLREYREGLLDRLDESLRVQCVSLATLSADDYAGADRAALEERVQRYSELTGRRITLIRRNGTVVADSERDAATMENHADRPEVRLALAGGFGTARRVSSTLGEEHLYVAHVPDHESERAGVVRLSITTADVAREAAGVRGLLLWAAVGASIAALAVGAFVMRRIAAPLEEMRRVAQALRGGRLDARSATSGSDAIGVLAGTLNQLGSDMQERVGALTAERERLHAMVASMVEGVVAVDEDDRVTFSNHAARRLLGLDPDVAEKGERLWEAARVTGLDGLLAEARRTDAATQRELDLPLAGREAVVQAQARRFADGDRTGVVVVLHDITELRRLERIRRDFVANVSHELKTPLTSIRGYVEALQDGALDDRSHNRRFLEKIEQNVGRLSHLVTDLLSLARIEEQEGALTLDRIDVHALVHTAQRRHEPAAQGREQQLTVETCDRSVRVLGDREALTQVLDNLIDNAIKYTPAGGSIRVHLETGVHHATISVVDDGIGIPLDEQDRIFERFYRVDKARSREVGGTGLGLSIVKHLVAAMEGEISVESAPGEGSTFRVRLQLAE